MRYAIDVHGYSERRACQLMEMNRRTFRRPPGPDRDAELRIRLRGLAEERRHFGTPRLQILLRREGIIVNHKCVERVYREEGLSLRLKHRRKRASHLRVVPPGPTGPNQHWAMDFVSDCLINGRRLRMLTVVVLYDHCCPVIEVDHSLTGERVARVLERLNVLGQCPVIIRTDNGPEFTGKALDLWAHGRGVRLEFIRPGKPTENSHFESFNGRFREECLNAHALFSLAEARRVVEAWRQDYNTVRPHSSLGGMSPEEYRRAVKGENTEGATTDLSLVHLAG